MSKEDGFYCLLNSRKAETAYCRGECFKQLLQTMTLEPQMTLALLQELLMALRANDADGYKSWLAHGIDQRGRDVVDEVKSEWMMQCSSVREERETPGSTPCSRCAMSMTREAMGEWG